LVLWVSDSGIGMSESEINTALQPFRQVANSLSRAQNGLGLGLSLVDGIVGLHHGRLELASAPGQGTTVTIALPPPRVLASV
jgi:signal transduction histidine kinase